ncbi:unnamed protein product [Rotaria sp. Silwood2]|nr:unnamed protein product [Rotaria sp. Silwood2]
MTSMFPNNTKSRIAQTKEALKELLKQIANNSGPEDAAILTMFDDTLIKPDFIPECKARDIATNSNMDRIDAIELSKKTIKTHFYSSMKEIYERLEEKPFQYIDAYVFSDGIDTSPRKKDQSYQVITRRLHEKIGAKCHFMNCGSASSGYCVAPWLGDPDADCPISGNVDEIRAQVASSYGQHHLRGSARSPQTSAFSSSLQATMTNDELESLRKLTSQCPSATANDSLTSADSAQLDIIEIKDNCIHDNTNSNQHSSYAVPSNRKTSGIAFSPYFGEVK